MFLYFHSNTFQCSMMHACTHTHTHTHTHACACMHTHTQLQNAKVLLDSPNGIEQEVHVKLDKSVWATSGCTEFFRHLNFELSNNLETHRDKVTLSAPAMKLERKMLYFAATAITAVFGE